MSSAVVARPSRPHGGRPAASHSFVCPMFSAIAGRWALIAMPNCGPCDKNVTSATPFSRVHGARAVTHAPIRVPGGAALRGTRSAGVSPVSIISGCASPGTRFPICDATRGRFRRNFSVHSKFTTFSTATNAMIAHHRPSVCRLSELRCREI